MAEVSQALPHASVREGVGVGVGVGEGVAVGVRVGADGGQQKWFFVQLKLALMSFSGMPPSFTNQS